MITKEYKYLLILAALVMLIGCHTAKSALSSDYDERPENKQLRLRTSRLAQL